MVARRSSGAARGPFGTRSRAWQRCARSPERGLLRPSMLFRNSVLAPSPLVSQQWEYICILCAHTRAQGSAFRAFERDLSRAS